MYKPYLADTDARQLPGRNAHPATTPRRTTYISPSSPPMSPSQTSSWTSRSSHLASRVPQHPRRSHTPSTLSSSPRSTPRSPRSATADATSQWYCARRNSRRSTGLACSRTTRRCTS
ncbi:hypothetical protein IG631_16654 [Alternaria alternata]|nr:hypothetical protein IG631_16654 [Alternaria alternata]